jgi:hypothetical protein
MSKVIISLTKQRILERSEIYGKMWNLRWRSPKAALYY